MEITLTDETEQIRNLASRVSGLPALPVIASRLLEAVDDPHTSAAEMAALISSDPALATRLLRLANSAFYGFPRKIGTVNLAVVVLGFETVRDLCLSVIIADCFFHPDADMPLNMEAFWKHSLSVAIGARMVYKMAGAAHPGEAFIAGLVHDTGKLFLARYFPSEFSDVLERVGEEDLPLLDAEREVFSVSHPVAGAWLLDEWNLPVWLIESTQNHHAIGEPGEFIKLSRSVSFADHLVRKGLGEEDSYGVHLKPTRSYLEPLKPKLDDDNNPDISYYLDNLHQELMKSEGFLNTIRSSDSSD